MLNSLLNAAVSYVLNLSISVTSLHIPQNSSDLNIYVGTILVIGNCGLTNGENRADGPTIEIDISDHGCSRQGCGGSVAARVPVEGMHAKSYSWQVHAVF